MNSQLITEKAILNALLALDHERWIEVLDFIGYLKQRQKMTTPKSTPRQMTARDLLQSNLVGLWADRTDIGDSVVFARQLRERAEQRGSDVAR
ncbi:MAG: hypothetical protein HZC38_21145 [Chloroflexi bacterium]|nr:hypothetical protein [Chloroflexota bacterium]MBI5715914.1 hypothetical protein [Chloroflexota bacterium]